MTRLVQVAAVEAEALQAEVVGHAARGDLLQALLQRLALGLQGGQADDEAVGGMGAALQLARVARALEDAQVVTLGGSQIRIGLARQVQAEPLAGQRLAILEARVADRLERHAGRAGDALRRILGVQATLFDPQPQVLAGT
ncbi:hypothetical protein D3C78_1489390 [compost metagenome]